MGHPLADRIKLVVFDLDALVRSFRRVHQVELADELDTMSFELQSIAEGIVREQDSIRTERLNEAKANVGSILKTLVEAGDRKQNEGGDHGDVRGS